MKWSTLLSKVVFAAGHQQEQPPPDPPPPPPGSPLHRQQAVQDLATPRLSSASTGGDEGGFDAAAGSSPSAAASLARGKSELESDFRRLWEEFRSSSSEKGKERALNLAVDVFCRLVKQYSSVAQLVTKLVEGHVFSFVIGRAFVTDVEKLRIHNKGRSLHVDDVISFFSDIIKLGICPGSNLLYAVEVLVTEVTSPGGNTVQTLKGKSGDKFEFKAPRGGMYKFFFHNPYGAPETVSFYIHVGTYPMSTIWRKMSTWTLSTLIAELKEALESVTSEQKYLKAREARHRHTNESTRKRVMFYTMAEYIAFMAASALQVLHPPFVQ